MRRFRKSAYLLLACISTSSLLFTARAGLAATMSDYCQVPPFVVSNIVPNVLLLVSNSGSMRKFAYTDGADNACTTSAPCWWDNVMRANNSFYGYFDNNYWYTYGSSKFTPTVLKSSRAKAAAEWDGNFLNWLTMRRADVLRRALTGGRESGGQLKGQIAIAGDTAVIKKFIDPANYTPFTKNTTVTATFSTGSAGVSSSFTVSGTGGISGTFVVDVDVLPGKAVEGVVQDVVGARARLGLAFYNSDNQGAKVDPPLGFTSLSSMVSAINTPSNINGGASQPIAEALYGIAGYFAQTDTAGGSGGLGLSSGSCLTTPTPCEPKYHSGANADFPIGNLKDPYNYGSGGAVRYPPCSKSFVLIITDGEPCADGNIPMSFFDNATRNLYKFGGAIPACSAGGDNVSGAEMVALWAHSKDLRSATIGKNAIDRTQNLTYFVIQAFGPGDAFLKRLAINGGFEDSNGNDIPDIPSEYGGDPNHPSNYFKAEKGNDLERALRDAFAGILKRASSGTAASVLASGEGSGANLVQAVFYPRRRFGNTVIMWTGSLQNLWYYVDPYIANASIHEDTVDDKILALDNDYLVNFVYDTDTDTTSIALNKTTATGAIDNSVAVVTRSFEQAKSLWEAGKRLYVTLPAYRRIFSIDNSTTSPRTKVDFTDNNYLTFRDAMNVTPVDPLTVDETTMGAIWWLRGEDFTDMVRPRTVSVQDVVSPDNVWKLGDIVHSTPRISGGVPLNSYYKFFSDWTYKAYTDNANYTNRGMVFTGGNDGMLHAFKLGKLEFSGTWKSSAAQKARLSNFDDNTVALGTELWAYVPRGALPYLQYLYDNNYCHLYYADLSPYIFDASIGDGTGDQSDDVRAQESWRTILIGGMRTGGACRASGGTCNSTTGGLPDCVKAPGPGGLSSYFAIDITVPTNPQVLWEFSDERLGFTTTGPAVVRVHGTDGLGLPDRNRNGHWFVVLGSGPTGPIDNTYNQFLGRSDQPLRLFVLNLKTGALEATIDNTGLASAFAGSMINATADFELDYQDDAVFFGYVKKDTATLTWTKGGVGRLATHGDPLPANWTFSKVIDDIGPVTSAVVRLQNNTTRTNWLYFGEGRYYYERDTEIDDANGQRRLYGVKDPCYKSSNLYTGGCTDTAAFTSLADQTTIDNTVTESVASAATFPGWYITLSNDNVTAVDYGDGAHTYWAERVITDPLSVTTTGTVFFTAYRPYNEMCNLGGKSFLWAVKYNTGGAPSANALQGKALIQVSTASVEQIDLSSAFSGPQNQGGRRSTAIEGVPPIAQGLSILTPPPPVKKILHMKEH